MGYKFAEIKEDHNLSFFRLTNDTMIKFTEANSPIISQIPNIIKKSVKLMVMSSCINLVKNCLVSYLKIKVNKN